MRSLTQQFNFMNSPAAIELMEAANAIEQVFQYYQLTLKHWPKLQEFVQTSPRIPVKLKAETLVGASDRTLGKQIPVGRTTSGGATRGMLKRLGLLTTTGGEYFRGCIVFGHRNTDNQIIAATGIRYGVRIRAYEKVMLTWRLPSPNEYKRNAIARARENFNEQAH